MVYGIEVSGNEILVLSLSGTKQKPSAEIVRPKLGLPRQNDSILAVLDIERNFEMLIQDKRPELVALCEGGQDSKKKRVRIEFAILCACEKNQVAYQTYSSSAAAKLVKSGFNKKENTDFKVFYSALGLAIKYQKAFVTAWRFFE